MNKENTVSILLNKKIHSTLKKLSIDRETTLQNLVNSILQEYIEQQCRNDNN